MKPWWRKSFTADIAEYLFHFPPAQTRAEAAEVLRRSRTRKGARVLDLACGVGRHTLEFARAGMSVVGLDASSAFLRLARRRAAASRRKVSFVHGDMREISRVLAPGGALVLNTVNERAQRRHYHLLPRALGEKETRTWSEIAPGCYALLRGRYDLANRRSMNTWIVTDTRSGRRKHIEKVYSFTVYSSAELKSMLRRAGLRLETVWGDMAGGRFDPERSKLLTLLARKG